MAEGSSQENHFLLEKCLDLNSEEKGYFDSTTTLKTGDDNGSQNTEDSSLPNKNKNSKNENGISNFESILHLVKSTVGTGIFGMPISLKYAGLWTGFFGIGIIGFIASHCMQLLVTTAAKLSANRFNGERLSYDVCTEEAVFEFCKKPKLARAAKIVVNIFICMTQFGFCTVYILFMATNLEQVIEYFTEKDFSVRLYQTIIVLFLIPFCWIKTLKVLTPFAMLGNILVAIGLVVIMQYCVQDLPPYWEYPAVAKLESFPIFFGMTIFAFESICLVLPIENKMKQPQDFAGFTGVLNTGMLLVIILYMAIGFFGYMKFGDDIQGSITLNMPTDHWLYSILKLLFASVVFITYALQFYPPATLIIEAIEENYVSSRPELFNYFMRTILVIGTYLLSVLVPYLDLMISLIGALGATALSLIFPPMLDILVTWPNDLGSCKWKLWKNIALILFGVFGFLTGTYSTVLSIIEAFAEGRDV